MARDAVVVGAVRTAMGRRNGALAQAHAVDLTGYMRDHGLRYGLQTMCEGGGTANATLLELV